MSRRIRGFAASRVDSFGAVRRLAREKHEAMKARASREGTAAALLAEARSTTNAAVRAVPPEHPLLAGGDGALHRTGPTPSIYISDALAPDQAAYVEAHEFGHLWIETPTEPAVAPRNSDPSTPEENTPLGLRRVEAYSPEELRERYANVFGREFLLPYSEAERVFGLGRSAKQIATESASPSASSTSSSPPRCCCPNRPPKRKQRNASVRASTSPRRRPPNTKVHRCSSRRGPARAKRAP